MARRFKEYPFPTVRQSFPWAGGVMMKNAEGVIETDNPTEVYLLLRSGFVEIEAEEEVPPTQPEPPTEPDPDGGDTGDGEDTPDP